MKKFNYISVGLVCSLLLLSACATSKKTESDHSSKTTKTTKSMKVSTTTTTKTEETTATEAVKDYDSLYGDTLSKLVADPERVATIYAFYDIDDNGTKELFTGYTSTDGVNTPLAAYYLKDGVSTYLADNAVGAVGGRRASFQVNEDGTVSQTEVSSANGNGSTKLYKLKSDNSGFDVIQEVAIEKLEPQGTVPSNDHPVDLKNLEWKKLNIPETTVTESTSKLDINAISQGDLSSMAGTYTGLNGGNTFTFNADGTGHITSSNSGWDVTFTNFRMEEGAAVFNTTSGPEMFRIVPAGVASSYDTEADDINHNRGYVNNNKFFLD